MTTALRQTTSVAGSITLGAVAGLAGGVLFGIMMAMMNILPLVGQLVGQPNSTVGFIVHMGISAIIGATYGVLAARLPRRWDTALVGGALYGVVWWVLGALVLMPLMLGMANMVLVVGQMQWWSLVGHLLYGAVTGGVFLVLAQRSS
ncbi:MAG: hypothetical protein Q9O62_05265 [Ardenticatenia bacterium]|nr:hypothetical protein [Ardenticatenia bacterium]